MSMGITTRWGSPPYSLQIGKMMVPIQVRDMVSDLEVVVCFLVSGGPGSSGMGGKPPTSFMDPGMMGKALTTGRILREHPDKFKDIGEAGGRFFKRTPAIQRRIDPGTAFSDMPPGSAYGTPGGYKFLDKADYFGKPESDPFFRGI